MPDVAEVWRRGSVVGSWLLDLTAAALQEDPELAGFPGRVSDSGEGRWTAHGGGRRGRPGARARRRAVRALQLARRGRLRGQAPVGPAQAVRRPRRADDPPASSEGDALVLFGITGDLAHKKLYGALCRPRGRRRAGRAGDRRGVERVGRRASCAPRRASVPSAASVDAGRRRQRCCARLRYVQGDYSDPATYERCTTRSGGAQHPVCYLAIPPSLFDDVAEGLAGSASTRGGRVVLEKPFGRDLASARRAQRAAPQALPRGRDLPHRPLPRQGAGRRT